MQSRRYSTSLVQRRQLQGEREHAHRAGCRPSCGPCATVSVHMFAEHIQKNRKVQKTWPGRDTSNGGKDQERNGGYNKTEVGSITSDSVRTPQLVLRRRMVSVVCRDVEIRTWGGGKGSREKGESVTERGRGAEFNS